MSAAAFIVFIAAAAGFATEHKKCATVVDSLGRAVPVPQDCTRLACLYAFTGHVVAMLGRGRDIVAVSNGLKRDVLLKKMYPSIAEALTPKFQGAINIEELLRTRPDLVFVSAEMGRNAAETAKLDSCGLTWIAVGFHTMEKQQRAIYSIGRAIGATEKAACYNAYYRRCIERVQQKIRSVPLSQRITIYHATTEATRTTQKNSLPADWIRAAGAINVAAEDSSPAFTGISHIDIEQILVWNPAVILVNEPGLAEHIMNSLRWSSFSAVQKSRVYQLPIGISRWGHPGSLETPLAILWTAQKLYPDLFADIDIHKEVSHFYSTFFNYPLSGTMVQNILNGTGMRLTKDRQKKQR